MIYNRYVAWLFLIAFLVLVLGIVPWVAPSFVMQIASYLLCWVPHDKFSPADVRVLGATIIGGGAIGAYVAFFALIAQFQINRYLV
jgi:hypothetical protein